MSVTFDTYVSGASWLHKLDPRVKLGFVALGTLLLLIWSSLPLYIAAVLLTHMLLLSTGYGWRRIAVVWRALAPFLIMIILFWPIFDLSGTPVLVEAGPLVLTGRAILAGIAAALRVASISFVFVIWLSTTDQRDLVRSFVRLGLPYRLGMAVTIGLRFIPTFAALFQTVSEAQQARGLVLAGRGVKRARGMVPILVSSLVTAFRMSEQLSWTLEARAFGAPVKRTTLRDLSMRVADWLILAGMLAAFTLLFVLTIGAGFGRTLDSPL